MRAVNLFYGSKYIFKIISRVFEIINKNNIINYFYKYILNNITYLNNICINLYPKIYLLINKFYIKITQKNLLTHKKVK